MEVISCILICVILFAIAHNTQDDDSSDSISPLSDTDDIDDIMDDYVTPYAYNSHQVHKINDIYVANKDKNVNVSTYDLGDCLSDDIHDDLTYDVKDDMVDGIAIEDYIEYGNTIDLIGEDAFREMKERVTALLDAHNGEQCVTVSLTSGNEDRKSVQKLHSLLPGDSLQLISRADEGLDRVDVVADDICIGSLLFDDAQAALTAIHLRSNASAYVAEQNCYGDCSNIDLSIVIFFTDEAHRVVLGGKKAGSNPIIFYQN